MNDTQQFQIINGTFTPPEASRVLLSLLQSKMDYHRLEKFSNEVRLGRDHSHSEKRLQELAKTEGALKELFASADEAKQRLRVNGWIEITLLPE
jgi:hypothetical protein